MQDIFIKRKHDILSKQDKSSKQSWDVKIAKLCEKINKEKNYYTTSSCAGRVILIIESDKKEHGLFVKIYHDLVSFDEFKRDLLKICDKKLLIKKSKVDINDIKLGIHQNHLIKSKLDNNKIQRKIMRDADLKQLHFKQTEISFKQEPCGLHVSCKTLKDSQNFLNKAKLAGWKKSGIISSNKRFVVECFSTEKLEFPIIKNKKVLVDDDFLKLIVRKSNENLKKSWEKIEKLEKLI